jgi:hypothetical protein
MSLFFFSIFGYKDKENDKENEKEKDKIQYDSYLHNVKFLIVLRDDDFKQRDCWLFHKTKSESLLQLRPFFPGKLEVISYSEYIANGRQYRAITNYEMLKTDHLYVQLPKERRYVKHADFAEYYLCSQLNDLKKTLWALNAESVKMTFANNRRNKGIDMFLKQMGFYTNPSSIEIRFPAITNQTQTQENQMQSYYQKKWELLIENRKRGANYADFLFLFENPIFFPRSFPTLNALGIVADVADVADVVETNMQMEVQCEIYYYPQDMLD